MKSRIKWKNLFLLVFATLLFVCFLFSSFKIVKWLIDSSKTKNQINNIEKLVTIDSIKDSESTEVIGDDINKNDPYWKYIRMDLIDVSFDELKKINADTVGWIQVSGTNINYPFVQTSNNEYYLNRSFNKHYNDAGWVFLDYRNNLDSEDKNIILYAHARRDKTMFGSLSKLLKTEWRNNKDNHVVRVSTEKENSLWQVFSVYHMVTTSDYIQTSFAGDEFLTLANKLIARSSYNFKTTINDADRIITLSSCYSDTEKIVMHAKLIKREIK